jgi:hypothetical protein
MQASPVIFCRQPVRGRTGRHFVGCAQVQDVQLGTVLLASSTASVLDFRQASRERISACALAGSPCRIS